MISARVQLVRKRRGGVGTTLGVMDAISVSPGVQRHRDVGGCGSDRCRHAHSDREGVEPLERKHRGLGMVERSGPVTGGIGCSAPAAATTAVPVPNEFLDVGVDRLQRSIDGLDLAHG